MPNGINNDNCFQRPGGTPRYRNGSRARISNIFIEVSTVSKRQNLAREFRTYQSNISVSAYGPPSFIKQKFIASLRYFIKF